MFAGRGLGLRACASWHLWPQDALRHADIALVLQGLSHVVQRASGLPCFASSGFVVGCGGDGRAVGVAGSERGGARALRGSAGSVECAAFGASSCASGSSLPCSVQRAFAVAVCGGGAEAVGVSRLSWRGRRCWLRCGSWDRRSLRMCRIRSDSVLRVGGTDRKPGRQHWTALCHASAPGNDGRRVRIGSAGSAGETDGLC